METTAQKIRTAIAGNGGMDQFSNTLKRRRPIGCPMKRMMVDELQELTNDELHVAFTLGFIGNKRKVGTIVSDAGTSAKRGAPIGNKNARKPAEMRVNRTTSRININIPRELKSAAVKAAYPQPLTAWVVDAIESKINLNKV